MKKEVKMLWIGIAILAILSPLGLLASGDAWGEWGAEEFRKVLGYIPYGLKHFSNLWNAPLPDYTIPWLHNDYIGYIGAAIIGILLVAIFTWCLGKILAKKEK